MEENGREERDARDCERDSVNIVSSCLSTDSDPSFIHELEDRVQLQFDFQLGGPKLEGPVHEPWGIQFNDSRLYQSHVDISSLDVDSGFSLARQPSFVLNNTQHLPQLDLNQVQTINPANPFNLNRLGPTIELETLSEPSMPALFDDPQFNSDGLFVSTLFSDCITDTISSDNNYIDSDVAINTSSFQSQLCDPIMSRTFGNRDVIETFTGSGCDILSSSCFMDKLQQSREERPAYNVELATQYSSSSAVQNKRTYMGGDKQGPPLKKSMTSWAHHQQNDHHYNHHEQANMNDINIKIELETKVAEPGVSMCTTSKVDLSALASQTNIATISTTNANANSNANPNADGNGNAAAPAASNSNGTRSRAKQTTASDPQSIAARHRRERISERLKILQELVPNGSKVDLVTMLEKAINYVKFLQLQVKVLTTDEYWPNSQKLNQPHEINLLNLITSKAKRDASNSNKFGNVADTTTKPV